MNTKNENALAESLRAILACATMGTNYGGTAYCISDERISRAREALRAFDSNPKKETRAPAVASGMSYLVTWTIDSDKETPEDAARAAWESMRSPDSIANVFDVLAADGTVTLVDVSALIEEDENGPDMWGEGYDSEPEAYADFARNAPYAFERYSSLYGLRDGESELELITRAVELDSGDPPNSWVFFHEWEEQKQAEGLPRKAGR